ncbi:MAG: pre-peptidase C-terminal domain-containing protein, partial [Gemmatimonadota bacterium]
FPVADGQSIEFKLSGGTGDADMYVNYNDRPASRDDYERVSGAADSNESVRYEAALAGVYHVLLHAFTDFSGTTLTVTTGLAVLPYNIELVFINAGTSTQNAAFTGAATRWEALLPIDITDIPFLNQPVEANSACGSSFQHPPIEDTVDDLRIFADIIEIDGPGGTLGQAGPCLIRSSSGLPVVGFMQFDEADLANLEAQGRLGSVILHEMGHVLGIGTVWGPGGADLLRDPSFGNPGQDTHFVGPLAIQAFEDAGGLLYGGQKVPVENSGVAGSTDGHWREIVMLLELFTPTLNAGFNPLSAISVQSLADVGYRVDATAADAYTITLPAAAAAAAPGPVIDLGGDIWRGPLMEVDGQGRIIRVIRR